MWDSPLDEPLDAGDLTPAQEIAAEIDRDPWWRHHDEDTGECKRHPCPNCD